jgi:hypothetical protein
MFIFPTLMFRFSGHSQLLAVMLGFDHFPTNLQKIKRRKSFRPLEP